MKSRVSFCVLLALSCFFVRSESSSASIFGATFLRRELQNASGLSSTPSGDCEQQVESASTDRDHRLCSVRNGIWRPGNTYNDPSFLRTANATECCEACREDDRCLSWSRDRQTGACGLKDRVAEPISDSRYESSDGEDIDALSETGTDAVSRSSTGDAPQTAQRGACYVESGVAYTGGVVLQRTQTDSATSCCELCRNNADCFSWHRNANTRRCVLNRNTPARSQRGRIYSGGSTI